MTPWTRAHQALLSSTASWTLVKFMLVASLTLSNHLVLCRPLLLLPLHFPNIRVFSRESSLLMRWPKDWSLSFRICPSSEHSGLISFRTGLFSLQSRGLSRASSSTTIQRHQFYGCLLYTSDAADEGLGVDLGGRRIIKKKHFISFSLYI